MGLSGLQADGLGKPGGSIHPACFPGSSVHPQVLPRPFGVTRTKTTLLHEKILPLFEDTSYVLPSFLRLDILSFLGLLHTGQSDRGRWLMAELLFLWPHGQAALASLS